MEKDEKIDELIEKMKEVMREIGWGKYELAVSVACSWDYYLGFSA